LKILIIQNKKIGDVLTTSILFEALKDNLDSVETHFFVYTNALSVLKYNPHIDKIWHCSEKEFRSLKGFYKWYKTFKQESFDIIIDAYAKLSTLGLVKALNPKQSISFKKSLSALFVKTNILRKQTPETSATLGIEHRLQLIEPIVGRTGVYKPKIYLSTKELESSKDLLLDYKLSPEDKLIMISVLGSEKQKTYPFQYMAKTLDYVVNIDLQYKLLFNYIPNQIEDVNRIYKLCQPQTQKQIYKEFYTKDLREFLGITKHCKVLIGNEGGAINMAKALDVPTFTIFSPQIKKNDWSIFEDGKQNISVHVDDYDVTPKNYENFKPELFKKELEYFCKLNINVK
jgi:heptosyltransferase-2